MKNTLKTIVLGPRAEDVKLRRLQQLYTALMLTLIAVGLGLLTLMLSAISHQQIEALPMFWSYFENPLLLALNLLPAILLVWLGYFLTGHCGAAVTLDAAAMMLMAICNYLKINMRGDPLIAGDILLIRMASNVVQSYSFDLRPALLFALGMSLFAVVYAFVLMPRRLKNRRARLAGFVLSLLAIVFSVTGIYANSAVYAKTANNALINIWSDTQVYLSRGVSYSFLRTVPDMFPARPEGYRDASARKLLESFEAGAIPEEEKVHVVSVMLEAFCDLRDFAPLAEIEAVQQVYAPWDELKQQSLSGRLLTNIFGGGTVSSEWEYLTGFSHYDTFTADSDSYVRYFASQGYDTHYTHPGYEWFYNRKNVNRFLGFKQIVFTESGFGDLVHVDAAPYHSDKELVDFLLQDLEKNGDNPLFSFAVSYQNHGPYESYAAKKTYVSPENSGLTEESCNILNHYLMGVEESLQEYARMVKTLEREGRSVVVVLYGDHKPWLGNDNSVYHDLGLNLDITTAEGLYNYHATPYLIYATDEAKASLEGDFRGDGGDFSPCFLMTRLFDACGWEGPALLQLSRETRQATPLLHLSSLFLQHGTVVELPEEETKAAVQRYLQAQYYSQHRYRP